MFLQNNSNQAWNDWHCVPNLLEIKCSSSRVTLQTENTVQLNFTFKNTLLNKWTNNQSILQLKNNMATEITVAGSVQQVVMVTGSENRGITETLTLEQRPDSSSQAKKGRHLWNKANPFKWLCLENPFWNLSKNVSLNEWAHFFFFLHANLINGNMLRVCFYFEGRETGVKKT